MGIPNLTCFESFEGATSRISGFPPPSTAHGRGAGKKGVGIDGLGLMVGVGFGLVIRPALVSVLATVGFAFKNWSDEAWGGSVTLCEMYNGLTGGIKARLAINAQKTLVLSSYDAALGAMVQRAVSTRSLKDDAWHYLELVWTSGGGPSCGTPANGTVACWINGNFAASFTGSTDVCLEDSPDPYNPVHGVTNFHLGVLGGFLNEARHMSFDDIYGAASASAVGDVYATELELDEDEITEWTPSAGTNHKAMVDEDPADDAVTYNEHTDVGYKSDSFTVVDVPGQPGGGGEVLGVQLSARMRKTRTAIWRYQAWLIVDDLIVYHLGEPLTYNVWTDMTHRVFWEAPGPPDELGFIVGHPWTWEELQAMRVGYVAWPPLQSLEGDYLVDLTPSVFIQV